jgi:hypothetical protein
MSGVYQNVDPHPLTAREDTLAGWRGGGGVNILEVARHCSVLYICKYFVLFIERIITVLMLPCTTITAIRP